MALGNEQYEGGERKLVLKAAPLLEDIIKLEAEGVNWLCRDTKLKGFGMVHFLGSCI